MENSPFITCEVKKYLMLYVCIVLICVYLDVENYAYVDQLTNHLSSLQSTNNVPESILRTVYST